MNSAAHTRAELDDGWRRIGWTVVGTKLRAARNRFAVTRRRNPLRTLIQFAFIAPAILLVVALFSVGFASAISGISDTDLATTLLATVIAVFALGSFVGTSTTALQALYLADDIPFLLTLPIPLRALFGGKFVEAATGALPPTVLFVSGMVGYGWDRSNDRLYWPIGIIIGFSLSMMATACSVIVVSLITRYIPPRRARLFLFGISLALIAATMSAWRSLAPRPEAFGEVVQRDEYEPLWNALSWTPIGWGARAMANAAEGSTGRALLVTALITAFSAVTIAISFEVFRHTFIRSLGRTRVVQTSTPNVQLTRWLGALADLMPRDLASLVLKEWLSLLRDLRRLSGAIWPMGIVLVYTVILGREDGGAFGTADFAFWSKNGSLALLPWGLSLGISVYSYGSEGRNVQLMRILPVSATRLFMVKVFGSLVPVALVSVGAAMTSLWIRSEPLFESLQLLALLCWMVAGFVVIDTAASAIAPNFETDQVQRTIGVTGRLFSVAIGGTFALATVAAAGRLVLMTGKPPSSIAAALDATIAGVQPLGWPLIVASALVASGCVAFSSWIAVKQTERIVLARP